MRPPMRFFVNGEKVLDIRPALAPDDEKSKSSRC
jgi:hypothetical protein